jgi:NTP pyrophosphatase (non-canonical NTP hydrolase)
MTSDEADATTLTLNNYQLEAQKTDRAPDKALAFPLLGLFGEVGTLLSVVKKKQRDAASYIGYAPHVIEELGDVLWYFATIAGRAGIRLSDIGHNINRGLQDWTDSGDAGLRFADLQPGTRSVSPEPTQAFENTLLNLAGEVGIVLSDFQAGRIGTNQAALKGRLVAVLRVLVQAANEAGVTLGQAAAANLHKTFDRWPEKFVYPKPFDEDEKAFEQLPRSQVIDVFEREVGGKLYVFQQCNGINTGDRLTDNALEPDDYRFHDVFHYAYAAVLTWSPVTRSLLRLKRKSKPKIDEVEDGARATLIEEGIATSIFGQAKQLKFFAGLKRGDLSFDMLKAIRQFVAGYEAERCPLWLWEEAILQGYEAFRFLREHRQARLTIDMVQRKLLIGDLPRDT